MSKIKKLGFLFAYSIPICILLSFYLPERPLTFIPLFYAFIAIPAVDFIIGKDRNNVLKDDFDTLLSDKYYDFLIFSQVYVQYALLIWSTYIVCTFPLTSWELAGLIVSQGVYGGTIINVAHELGHRKKPIAQLHAKAALISVGYIHFIVEHNRGHHVHVATPRDPATSRKNQSLYAFWKQTLIGSFKSAWDIERNLLAKKKEKLWSFKNTILSGHLLTTGLIILASLVGYFCLGFFTWKVLLLLVAQCVIAVLLLETVNYIEHYGIMRQEIAPGKYERVNPLHSWNANHFYSNLLLFNLQRHSDHHAYASRPYQVLRHFDESPQLPFGYPLMTIMATIPSLWFKIMNKKLETWQAKSVDKEHIQKVVKQFA